MKDVEEIRESPICPTCGGEKVWVDARFEPPSQQKLLKEWKKRYDEWLKLKGSAYRFS
ncbi:hypothetical protein EXIGLDRAFT_111854 [Exidia glandulosa HHB12029]|uniref:Uncharacterized protein n=1 Tax=Exidia glandulosa HHB12029 TaxID=1314781 RepID=A0A166BGJ7_EXIGL|nr:hypothetical protein EXIGLDRAFT_111854 [Exidia glandulosa HHB12029]